MSKTIQHLTFTLALITALILSSWRNAAVPIAILAPATYSRPNLVMDAEPSFKKEFLPIAATTPEVHSATIVELANGNLLAAWFGGSREGAADVAIYASEHKVSGWSPVRIVAERINSQLALGQYVRKLGNPVLTKDANGRIWLFVVIASLGGWSTSSIAYTISTDNGQTFSRMQQLITSPLLNISTLIRGNPLLYTDGSIAIPAYHELLGKFGLAIRLHPNGRILSITNIGSGRTVLQPTFAAINSKHIVALLRRTGNSSAKILSAYSYDAGINWTIPQPTNLPNPDSSIAALSGLNNEILLVYNPLERGRHILSLASSNDGLHWHKRCNLELGIEGDEFSYPFLISDSLGNYHLVYTWKRQRIAYLQFNHAWLTKYCT